jgi:hypothetical protein
MTCRGVHARALVFALGALIPLAYASPPDPTWIAGIYDDADHDDVVTLIVGYTGTRSPAEAHVRPSLLTRASCPDGDEPIVSAAPLSSGRVRAPPTS